MKKSLIVIHRSDAKGEMRIFNTLFEELPGTAELFDLNPIRRCSSIDRFFHRFFLRYLLS
jgi:hypothetical protein